MRILPALSAHAAEVILRSDGIDNIKVPGYPAANGFEMQQ
jgi:hypothetical protein